MFWHTFACSLSPYRCLVGFSSENVRGHAARQAPVIKCNKSVSFFMFHASNIFKMANEVKHEMDLLNDFQWF